MWTWTGNPGFPSENPSRGMSIEGDLTNGVLKGKVN